MVVSDLRGSLGPKFYETELAAHMHSCDAAIGTRWSDVTATLHASAGQHNLRWTMRSSDHIGQSSSEPAVVTVSPSSTSASYAFLLSPPLFLLRLSLALNTSACNAPVFNVFTKASARACLGEESGLEAEGHRCSGVSEVHLRCSASPTAGVTSPLVIAVVAALAILLIINITPTLQGDAFPPAASARVTRDSGLWCEVRAALGVGQQFADALRRGNVLMRASVWLEGDGAGLREVKSEGVWVAVG